MKTHANILESDGAEEADEKLRRVVTDTLGEASEADWVHAHLRPLVVASSDRELGADRRAEAFAAWRRFFEALAMERPLILVFEDVHWADDTLLDFVEYLVEWTTQAPLLVLATSRPELLDRRPTWAGPKPDARTLMLAPLSDEETTRLLASLLERPLLEAEAQATLLTQAAGNPLYAEEYVRLLSDSEGAAEPGTTPETVQGIIAARIDALSVDEKALLQDAAVVGRVFWSGVVAALAGRDRWTVEGRVLALEQRQLLRRERRSAVEGETEYAFHHELVRDVAYGEIPHGERAAKHLRAAEWIESLGRPEDHVELLVHHYLSSLEYGHGDAHATTALAEQARLALRDAGDRAFGLNAFAQAAGFYGEALKLWPADDPGRPRVLFRFASALHVTGDPRQEELLEQAREALRAAGELEAAAEVDTLLAEMWWMRGRNDRLDQCLQRGVLLIGSADSPSKARVLGSVARFRMRLGDMAEATRVGRETLALGEALEVPDVQADALITVGMARWLAGDAGGEADLERGIALALEANALRVAQRGYNNLAIVMGDRRLAGRMRLLEQAQALAERLGDTQTVRFYQAQLADELEDLGKWDEAMEIADGFIADCEAGSSHVQEAEVRQVRARIRFARGQVENAFADWEHGLTLARRLGHPTIMIGCLGRGAIMHADLGNIPEAQALADELLSHEDEAVSRAAQALAWVAARIGRDEELRAKFTAAPPAVERVADLVLAGELATAVNRLAAAGSRSEEADTRVLAARQLVKEGRYGEANEQLEKALTFYRSVDATRLIQGAESLLTVNEAHA